VYNCIYFCEIKQYFDEPVGRVNRNDAQKWTMGNETARYSVRYEIFLTNIVLSRTVFCVGRTQKK